MSVLLHRGIRLLAATARSSSAAGPRACCAGVVAATSTRCMVRWHNHALLHSPPSCVASSPVMLLLVDGSLHDDKQGVAHTAAWCAPTCIRTQPGIESHRCMEMTPSLACSNKCVFCWRHHTNPVGRGWSGWKMDDPLTIVDGAVKQHVAMINEYKGAPGVLPARLAEGYKVRDWVGGAAQWVAVAPRCPPGFYMHALLCARLVVCTACYVHALLYARLAVCTVCCVLFLDQNSIVDAHALAHSDRWLDHEQTWPRCTDPPLRAVTGGRAH